MIQFWPVFVFTVWFTAVFALSYGINWLLARSIIWRWYRVFVAPGVIVHELSHALACLLTKTPVEEINFWKPTGGHVRHLLPPTAFHRFFATPFIALAPIPGTFLVLAGITAWLAPELFEVGVRSDITSLSSALPLGDWRTWIYLYLITSLAATIAPSAVDMRYALASIVIGMLALIGASFIPAVSRFFASVLDIVEPWLWITIALLLVATSIAFVLAIPNRNKHFVAKEQIE